MAARNKTKTKASSKEKDDAFFIYEEDKKDLGTIPSNNSTIEESANTKNVLYIYKDKTTCRVTYDGSSDIYKTVHIG